MSKRELEPIKSKLLRCRPHLRLGIIVPHTQWLEKKRKYLQIISNSLNSLDKESRFLLLLNDSSLCGGPLCLPSSLLLSKVSPWVLGGQCNYDPLVSTRNYV